MIEMVSRSVRSVLIVALAPGLIHGVASAQERSDSPQDIQNVQLVFHLVQADGFTDRDPEISDVVTELRKLFNFQGYRLLSTSVLNVGLARATAGSASVTGGGAQRIVPGDSSTPLTISADISARRSTRTVRARVTLTEGVFRWTGGSETTVIRGTPTLLEASVTIRDGQRVVLGSARRAADDPVLILVVTPRIDPQ